MQALPWPDAAEWITAARGQPARRRRRGRRRATARCDSTAACSTSTATGARSAASPPTCSTGRPARRPASTRRCSTAGLDRLFGTDADDLQRAAARAAVEHRFAVVAGGPGTGKTTTVARILALLAEQAVAAGQRLPRVALAAPTGKAAARLEESVHHEAA